MQNIRAQAKAMGHEVAGVLKRGEDFVFWKNGEEMRDRIYFDSEGTEYAVNQWGGLVYIAGDDWII